MGSETIIPNPVLNEVWDPVGLTWVRQEQIDVTSGSAQVTVVGSVLPTGAATAARQDTGNTSLSSIDGKTPALGQALGSASVPVVLPVAQITTLTPPSSVTINNGAGASAVNIQDGGNSITVDGTVTVGAGSAVIGHVIADSGSTTAVTGNVTVVQSTNASLKADVTSNAANIATESTLSSLNGKVTACNTGAVVLAAGSAVVGHVIVDTAPVTHVIADSGTITTVTSVTGATINNGSGASAVNIQDGGNSITVDGSVSATVSGTVAVSSMPEANTTLADGISSSIKASVLSSANQPYDVTKSPVSVALSDPFSDPVDQGSAGSDPWLVCGEVTANPGKDPFKTLPLGTSAAKITPVTSSTTSATITPGYSNRGKYSFYNDSTATAYLAKGYTASSTEYTTQVGSQLLWEDFSTPPYYGPISVVWASANGTGYLTEEFY